MIGIWHWPAPNSKSAIRSGQRITISMPNIISDRCPRDQERLENHTKGEATESIPPTRLIPCGDFLLRMYCGRHPVADGQSLSLQLTHSTESPTIYRAELHRHGADSRHRDLQGVPCRAGWGAAADRDPLRRLSRLPQSRTPSRREQPSRSSSGDGDW